MTQIQQILDDLKQGKKITAIDALRDYGCMNLKGRIWDIKQMGYNIAKDWHETNSKKYVALYYIDNNVPIGTNFTLFN